MIAATSVDPGVEPIAWGTEQRLDAGVQEGHRAVGIDPVFMAPIRPNSAYDVGFEGWVVECQQVRAAADKLGAPVIDPMLIYGVDRPQFLDPRRPARRNGVPWLILLPATVS